MQTLYNYTSQAIVAALLFSLPVLAVATCKDGELCNPLVNNMGLWEIVEFLVRDVLVAVVAPIAIVLALLWSGFAFIKAQGNVGELATARRNFMFVILGSVLLLGAYVILNLVQNTVGQLIG